MSSGDMIGKPVAHGNDQEDNFVYRRRASSFFDEQEYKTMKSQRVAKGNFVVTHSDVPIPKKPPSTPSSFIGVDRNMSKRSLFGENLGLRSAQGIYKDEDPDEMRSYHLEPTRRFCEGTVRTIIQEEITRAVDEEEYPNRELSLMLANSIKTRLKQCNFSRYKYVTTVDVGQNKSQGVRIASRFFWDSVRDRYVTETRVKNNVFVVVTVYAVYFE